MEKAFALKTAIPTLATNGRVAVFPTLDRNVTMLLILKEGFEWENRKKERDFPAPAAPPEKDLKDADADHPFYGRKKREKKEPVQS